MPAASEDVVFRATFDGTAVEQKSAQTRAQVKDTFAPLAEGARQAQKEVDRLAVDMERGKGALRGFQVETQRASQYLTGVSDASTRAGGGAKELQEKFGKAGAVISGFSGAMGLATGSTGQTVSAISNLASAFIAGGPLLAGISAATIAAGLLADQFKKAAEEEEAAYVASLSGFALLAANKTQIEGEVRKLRQALGVDKLSPEEIENQGVSRLESIRREIVAREAEIRNASTTDDARSSARTEISVLRQTLRADAQRIDLEAKARRIEIKAEDDKAQTAREAEAKIVADKLEKDAEENGVRVAESFSGGLISEFKRGGDALGLAIDKDLLGDKFIFVLTEAIEPLEQYAAENKKTSDEVEKQWERAENERVQKRKEHLKELEDLEKKNADTIGGYVAEGVGVAVSGAQYLTDALITGQEHAFEHMVALIMKQAGTSLIGHGIDAIGGGVAQLLLTEGVVGGAAVAGGLGLVGAGIALGGISTGIEHSLAGGQIGQAVPERTFASPGSGLPGSSSLGGASSASSNGPVVVQITNNYGLGVPKEKSARDLAELLDHMVSRGITPQLADVRRGRR